MKATRSHRSELVGAGAVLLTASNFVLGVVGGLINEPRWFYWGVQGPVATSWLFASVAFIASRAHDLAVRPPRRTAPSSSA